MTWLVDVMLLVHVVGFAMTLGPLLLEIRNPEPPVWPTVFYGSLVALASGVAMVGMVDPTTATAPAALKVGCKVIVGLVVTGLAWANQRWDHSRPAVVWLLAALVILEGGMGVLWH